MNGGKQSQIWQICPDCLTGDAGILAAASSYQVNFTQEARRRKRPCRSWGTAGSRNEPAPS